MGVGFLGAGFSFLLGRSFGLRRIFRSCGFGWTCRLRFLVTGDLIARNAESQVVRIFCLSLGSRFLVRRLLVL